MDSQNNMELHSFNNTPKNNTHQPPPAQKIIKKESSTMMDKDSKKCQDCSIVFLTSFRLQRHIKKFHGGVTPTMASSDTIISDDRYVY
jgi:hypothetical protein